MIRPVEIEIQDNHVKWTCIGVMRMTILINYVMQLQNKNCLYISNSFKTDVKEL